MATKLKDVENEFAKYIAFKDPHVLKMIFATTFGNSFNQEGNPLWLIIIAPSSGGKSTVIAPISGIGGAYFVDDMTDKTLMSGFKVGGKEYSLLKIINKGMIVHSDFTAILKKNPQTRAEILSQYRMVFDGVFVKHTGSGKITWNGRIGFLAAATPEIYHELEAERSMGERFSYFEMQVPNDQEIAKKIASVGMSSKAITAAMSPVFHAYYDDFKEWLERKFDGVLPPLKISDERLEEAMDSTIFCVNAKTTVHLDFKSKAVDRIPNKASVGRDHKMALDYLKVLMAMEMYEKDTLDVEVSDEMLLVIKRMSFSSMNRERRKILEILCMAEEGERLTASEIGTRNNLGFQKEAVEMYLNPLNAMNIVQKEIGGKGNAHKWFVKSEKTRAFVLEMVKYVDNSLPEKEDEGVEKLLNNDDESPWDSLENDPWS